MQPEPAATKPILEFQGITKEFEGNHALKGIDLALYPGEVHGLLGENGAGKSTLIKILTGVYTATSGSIKISGKQVHIGQPLDAHRLGIGAVYQDAELVESVSVAENVMLGAEPGGLFIKKKLLRTMASDLLNKIGVKIDPGRPASTLSAAEMQLVLLSNLFQRQYKVFILDEPTSRLSASAAQMLFRLIRTLQEKGVTIIYISHRLEEIQDLCDRVTVLRGGLISGTRDKDQISEREVTLLMIDKDSTQLEVVNPGLAKDVNFARVSDLITERLRGISFVLRKGEVLGVTGPVGGGREDIGMALSGLMNFDGKVEIESTVINLGSPAQARRAGIALIPEDRRKEALFNDSSTEFNLCLPMLKLFSRFGWVLRRPSHLYALDVIKHLGLRPSNPNTAIRFLSGGNQQKAVIGKWLKAKAKLYIFIEPTAGVDVGAIKEIYEIILDMAKSGASVIVVSSSIKEILTLSEKVMVIQDGRSVLYKDRRDTTYGELLSLAMGCSVVDPECS